MKETIVVLVLIVLFSVAVMKCDEVSNQPTGISTVHGFSISDNCRPIQFVWDDKDKLCFAYGYCGQTYGGPMLTVVPDRVCNR